MILIDFSQIVVASAFALKAEIVGNEYPDILNILRHGVLTSIKNYRGKYCASYGSEVIILCDGESGYWRKDLYEHYKGNRKENRDKSDMPWEEIQQAKKTLIEELRKVLPYRIMQHPKAEADDLFAIVVREIANKRKASNALFDDTEPVLMVASDGDLKQLHSSTVQQYSPTSEKLVKLDGETPDSFLKQKILTGDSGDFVPNVFNPIDCLHEKVRQKPATQKKMEPILKFDYDSLEEGTDDPLVKERIQLNRKLVSFYEIPKWIVEEVVADYSNKIEGSREKLYRYLAANKCNLLLGDIQKF